MTLRNDSFRSLGFALGTLVPTACSIHERPLRFDVEGGDGSAEGGGGDADVADVASSEDGATGLLGASCATPGELGCNGPASRQQLLCDPTFRKWVANGLCPEVQRCDSMSQDASPGMCRDVVQACAGLRPGDHVCITEQIRSCGPDLVSTDLVDACSDINGECAQCRPVTLASGQSPRGLAVDASSVYWVNWNVTALMRVPKGGGTPETLASNAAWFDFAVDSTGIYGLASTPPTGMPPNITLGSVEKVLFTGGREVLARSSSRGNRIALDGATAYWTLTGMTECLMSVPLTAGNPVTLVSLPPICSGLSVDGRNVYYTTTGMVMKVPRDGGTPTSIASGQGSPSTIAVDATTVYWCNGTLWRASLDGGTPTMASSETCAGGDIVVDATSVYFTGMQALLRVPIGGGTTTVLAGGGARRIALDATHVYWTDGAADGLVSVKRIAK